MSTEIKKISEGAKALTERLDAIRTENMSAYMEAAQSSYSDAKSNHDSKMDEVAELEAAAAAQYEIDLNESKAEMQARYDHLVSNINATIIDSFAELKTFNSDMNATITTDFVQFGADADADLAALEAEIGVVEDVEALLETLVPGYSGAA